MILMSQSSNDTLLKSMLSLAVPLHILRFVERGGPSNADFQTAQSWSDICASRGDNLLFPSKKRGETAELFNGLAHAIAVLSFLPGGVETFGFHFETILD